MRSPILPTIVAVLLLSACGGERSYTPQNILDSIESTNEAFAEMDGALVCERVRETMALLAEWERRTRNRLQIVVNETLQMLSGVTYHCMNEEPDIDRIEPGWTRAVERLKKATRQKAGWGTLLKYMLMFIPVVFLGWWFRRWMWG